MEALLARLLAPLFLMLIVGAAGIAALVVDYRKSRELLPELRAPAPTADGEAEPKARPLASLPMRIPRPASPPRSPSPRDTLLLKAGPRETQDALPRPKAPAAASPPAGPFRTPEGPPPAPADPPTITNQAARAGRLVPSGGNIVINQPRDPSDYLLLPGKLEVIYGNFSPSDPREILFYSEPERTDPPRYVFSKRPGGTVYHVQLNHYTVTPQVQAELTFEEGRHVLVNTVPADEMDRYQTRVNGVPLAVDESHVLVPGDIVSLGIYRVKLVL